MLFPPIDVKPLIEDICKRVPAKANRLLAKDPKKVTTCWTKALKTVLDELGKERGFRSLYTQRSAGIREFMLDFVWWDDKAGCGVLGCESEFGNSRYREGNPLLVGEDFDKLLSFKSPIKLMVFNSYTGTGPESLIRPKILTEINRYLSDYSFHLEGETYIAIDISEDPKVWTCHIDSEGKNPNLKFVPFSLGKKIESSN